MEEMILLIVFAGVLFGGTFGVGDFLASNSCSNYEQQTGIETKYKHFDECFIKTPSGWMRWDEYKARAITNTER